jgi:hypothetical protein
MKSSHERDIQNVLRSLRQVRIDPSLSGSAVERVKASMTPAPRRRHARMAAAGVGIAALLSAVLYLRLPQTSPPARQVRPVAEAPQSLPVAPLPKSPAEELKQAAVRSQQAGAIVHVPYVELAPDSSGRPRVNPAVATVRAIGNNNVPATRPLPDRTFASGMLPITWEATTIPIPLDWPNLQIRPLFIGRTTNVEKIPQAGGTLYRLSNLQTSPTPAGAAPATSGTVWVDSSSGLITRMQLPANDFQSYRELKLTYEPSAPAVPSAPQTPPYDPGRVMGR